MGLLERQKRVVKYLRDSDTWVKGCEIGQVLEVTDRTIRNDIIAINRLYEKDIIISVKGKGYRYNELNKEGKLDSITEVGMLSTIERWVYIVKSLIVAEKGINLFELSEELFISESTLQNDIIKIKRVFSRAGIDYASIIKSGEVINLKCNLSERYLILYEFVKYKFVNLQLSDMQKYFSNINLRKIYNSIADILQCNNYTSKYLMLTKVTIFVALVVECKDFIICSCEVDKLDINNIKIAEKITEFICEEFKIVLNLKSMINIAYHLNVLSNMDVIEENIRRKDNIYFNEYNVYEEKILSITSVLNVNLSKDIELFHDMIIHIMIAVKRIKLGIKIYNPLRENLKSKYPLLFGFASKLVRDICLYENVKFDFNELSYIVAYLSTMVYKELDKLKKIRDINILLVVSDGRANLNYIYNEIKKGIVYNGINIEKICFLNEINYKDINSKFDTIITTSREDVKFDVNDYIEIRKNFDIVERNKVIAEIDKIRIGLIEEKIESVFDHFFRDENFYNIDSLTSQDKMIKDIYKLFACNNNISPNEYFQKNSMKISLKSGIGLLYKRDLEVKQDKMALFKLKDPINWCDDKVKIIIYILDNSDNTGKINLIINYLLELVEKPDLNEKMKKCASLQDIKKLIIESYLKGALG